MALSRFFQNSTQALFENSNSTSSSSSLIDFNNRDVVVGVSTIGGVMAFTYLFFLVKNYRASRNTLLTFKVAIHQNDAHSFRGISIDDLQIKNYDLTDRDQLELTKNGMKSFLQNKIREILAAKTQRGEPIQNKLMIHKIAMVFFSSNEPTVISGKFDTEQEISIEYIPPSNRCNFFATFLLPFMQSSVLFEVLLGVTQQLGSLQLSEKVLPVSQKLGTGIVMTQTALATLYELFMYFIGPSQAFTRDLASTLDKKISNLLCSKKNENHELEPYHEPMSKRLQYGSYVVKMIFLMFILNNLFTKIMTDYQTTMSLNDKINAQSDPISPTWLVYFNSLIKFGLKQMKDPFYLMNEIMLIFTLVDVYFDSKAKKQAAIHAPVSDDSDSLEEDIHYRAFDDEEPRLKNASLLTSPQLGLFASKASSSREDADVEIQTYGKRSP